MKRTALLLLTTALPFLGAVGAHATPTACATASVATYDAKGFSCMLGSDVLLSNFTTAKAAGRGGSSTLGDIVPVTGGGTLGIAMTYDLSTGPAGSPFGVGDVNLTFHALALNGAQFAGVNASVIGTESGGGTVSLVEQISGQTLSASPGNPGSITFDPTTVLNFHKDQLDAANNALGIALSTRLEDDILLSGSLPVDEPGSLPLFALGLVGMVGAFGWKAVRSGG